LDGSTVEVEVTAIAFIEEGHASAHLVVRAITERLAIQQQVEKVEMQLQQAQKMEAVGALAGGVAHEVNNMLSVILGFSDFVLKDQSISAEHRDDLRQIVKAADRAATVTSQLLAFSRRSFNRTVPVRLDTALQELTPVLQRLLGEDRRLIITLEGTPVVRIDHGQLEQVIVNLALNARAAMPPGGTLTITVSERDSTGADAGGGRTVTPGRYGIIRVADTGSGIEPGTLARIFEPFFTTKPLGEGTGLGLAAVYGIITQHDGYIIVESEPGLGASFTLFLPLMEKTEADGSQPPRASSERPRPAEATVLVVDDEPAVREIAARSLARHGYRVIQATGGAEALERAEHDGPPDLLLTDLVMPGIGGVALARRLRERWPDLAVIFMSGYSAADLRHQGVHDVQDELLVKPFSPDRLVAAVGAALEKVPADQ
jgi:signal transduction histidine kinase/CheY-like chemotaxis protein